MHCKGCSNLIKMSLEDEGLTDVVVDIETNSGKFNKPENDSTDTKTKLDAIFSTLPGYAYTDLKEAE